MAPPFQAIPGCSRPFQASKHSDAGVMSGVQAGGRKEHRIQLNRLCGITRRKEQPEEH